VKLVGGRATSVVPFEAEMNLDVRVPIQFSTSQVFEQIQKIITKYQTANPKIFVKATVLDTVEPFEVNKASPLVHVFSSSVRKVLNKPATLLHKTGTGDMNILGKAMNLPIVTYGPGDSHLDHLTSTSRQRNIWMQFQCTRNNPTVVRLYNTKAVVTRRSCRFWRNISEIVKAIR
jgi:acetylornithine deacetylase/succinyl-diaminopimelate desuccinylase-like protein